MPGREIPLIEGHIYHIYNKSIDRKKLFVSDEYCKLFLGLLLYYRSTKSVISYSKYKSTLSPLYAHITTALHQEKYFKSDILAYSLMPNHFHLLLYQKKPDGIAKYLSDVLNAFTRFHNLKNDRKGPLFLPRFKSVLIASDEQLIHVSRYIHLNHYSKRIVKTMEELESYPWTSYGEYIGKKTNQLCNPKKIMELFNYDVEGYRAFTSNHADYQQKLEDLKKRK